MVFMSRWSFYIFNTETYILVIILKKQIIYKEHSIMKTLYVSDLDGTLLRSNETISEYTNNVINRLTSAGAMFTYATARSFITSKKVTKELIL